mgnify:CR=1 FL=1
MSHRLQQMVTIVFFGFLFVSLNGCLGDGVDICRQDADCPSHQKYCITGVCKVCKTDAHCDNGQSCTKNMCTSIQTEQSPNLEANKEHRIKKENSPTEKPVELPSPDLQDAPHLESALEQPTKNEHIQDERPTDEASPVDAGEHPQESTSPEPHTPDKLPTPPEKRPDTCVKKAEICNGVDDDCDGTIDEGCCKGNARKSCYTGPSSTRKKGNCRDGYSVCTKGVWGKCTGQVLPSSEVCDGKDNNCDGKIDDGSHINGQSCSVSGGKGNCLTGKRYCQNAKQVCIAINKPTPEMCDGKDNDCDGKTDEGCKQWLVNDGSRNQTVIYDLHVDSKGSIYITGLFDSSFVFGGHTLKQIKSSDIFVAKLDSDGNVLWAKAAGGSGGDYGASVHADAQGNTYLTGNIQNSVVFGSTTLRANGSTDLFIAKLDTQGKWLWAKRAGGKSNDLSRKIVTEPSGTSYVTGYFTGTAYFGTITSKTSTARAVFVAKIGPAGQFLWVQRLPSGLYANGADICTDTTGNVYLTGSIHGTTYFGSTKVVGRGNSDIFWLKLDSNGKLLHHWHVSGSGYEGGQAIFVDAQSQVYVAGYFFSTVTFGQKKLSSRGLSDGFLTKFDKTGKLLWVQSISGKMREGISDVLVDKKENIFIVGQLAGCLFATCNPHSATFGTTIHKSRGQSDGFVAKLDKTGKFISTMTFGGKKNDWIAGIEFNPAGRIVVGGSFQETAYFKSRTLRSHGKDDLFVASYSETDLFK